MAFAQLLIVILACLCLHSLAQRWGLQPEILILVVACAASFIPGIPHFQLSPEIILGLVTPPLLYSAALHFSPYGFVRNLRPILGLGVGLVAATTLVTAGIARHFLPDLGLAGALTLGAILSPPDTAGTVSHGSEFGVPRRMIDILTGESLINDAAALTFFGLGVAAVVGKHEAVENPALALLVSVVVGSLVGFVVGLAAAWARLHLSNPTVASALNLIVPFAAYLIAEELESSDVFAVVIAGFTVSTATWLADRRGRPNALPAVRLQEAQIWPVVDVLLESFVFAYIGLQCKTFLLEGSTPQHSRPAVIGIALVLLVVVIVVRVLGVFLLYARAAKKHRLRVARRSARAERHLENTSAGTVNSGSAEPRLGWTSALLGSWAGMRGILTLAAAASIPLVTSSGAPFPERDAIQRIAFIVTIGTIVIQGLTMPSLARALRFDSSAQLAEAETMLRQTLDVSAAAARSTSEEADGCRYARQRRSVIDELRARRITDTVASQAIHHIDLQESAANVTSR